MRFTQIAMGLAILFSIAQASATNPLEKVMDKKPFELTPDGKVAFSWNGKILNKIDLTTKKETNLNCVLADDDYIQNANVVGVTITNLLFSIYAYGEKRHWFVDIQKGTCQQISFPKQAGKILGGEILPDGKEIVWSFINDDAFPNVAHLMISRFDSSPMVEVFSRSFGDTGGQNISFDLNENFPKLLFVSAGAFTDGLAIVNIESRKVIWSGPTNSNDFWNVTGFGATTGPDKNKVYITTKNQSKYSFRTLDLETLTLGQPVDSCTFYNFRPLGDGKRFVVNDFSSKYTTILNADGSCKSFKGTQAVYIPEEDSLLYTMYEYSPSRDYSIDYHTLRKLNLATDDSSLVVDNYLESRMYGIPQFIRSKNGDILYTSVDTTKKQVQLWKNKNFTNELLQEFPGMKLPEIKRIDGKVFLRFEDGIYRSDFVF